jgi:hypothetical protein
MKVMKNLALLFLPLSMVFLSYIGHTSAATTKAPGCYAMAGPGLVSVNCQTLLTFFPDFRADSTKCYFTSQSNTTYTTPVEVPCNAVPTPGDPIPQPPDSVTQKPPIPIGCPGSNIQGPPSPDNLAVCASIPIGCPGSTQQGPPPAGFNINDCPYGTGQPTNPENTTTTTNNSSSSNSSNDGIKDPKRVAAQKCTGPDCITKNPVIELVQAAINFFSVLVGLIVIIRVIMGGIEYASAGGNPNKVAGAKKTITNALLAFVMYIFLWAFLEWLIPGGVLS